MNDNEQTILPGQDNAEPSNTPQHSFPYAINARYSCIELLGRGGSGAVYRARDNKLQRDVAIKFINTDQRLARDRFISEARLLAKLEHDRICRVYEVAEEGPALYMVMQYVPGATLNDWRTLLTTRQLVQAIQQVAAGVAAVHQQGVIHRDIKPANIALTTDAQQGVKAVLLDFGIASDISNATLGVHAGQGSLFYMAPEQAHLDPQQITPAADVYSLGATLYFLLSGEPVLASRRTTVARAELSQDSIIPLQQLNPKLPKDLALVVMHCLQRAPEQRYPSAQQLADDLQRWLNHQPVSLLRSPAYRIAKWYRRSPAAGLMITGLSLVLIAAVVLFAYYQQQVGVRELRLQRFTEQVKNIEAEVRFIRMSPMTNIEDDMRQLSRRAEEFAAQAANDSDFFAGPAWYAAGRTFYSLGRYNDAYRALRRAWQSDYQNPNAALYLALTHSELYQQGQQFAASIQNPSERERYLQQLQDEHQQPALNLLQRVSEQSQNESIPNSYLNAVAAYLNDNLNAADSILQRAHDIPVWFYEAERLAATLDYQRAVKAADSDDAKQLEHFYSSAEQHYEELERTAPNYTAVYIESTRLNLHVSGFFFKISGDIDAYIKQIETTITQIETQTQADYRLWLLKAELAQTKAIQNHVESKPATLLNNLALSYAEKAYRLEAKFGNSNDDVTSNLSKILQQTILHYERERLPLTSLVSRFKSVSEKIPLRKRDVYYYYNNAAVYQSLSLSQIQRKGVNDESLSYLNNAMQWFEAAIKQNPSRSGLYINYTNYLTRISTYLPHDKALQILDIAKKNAEKSVTMAPDSWVAWYFRGTVYDELAKFETLTNSPAHNAYDESIKSYTKAMTLNPRTLFPVQAIISPMIYRGIGLPAANTTAFSSQLEKYTNQLESVVSERQDDSISNHFYLLSAIGRFLLRTEQGKEIELPSAIDNLINQSNITNPDLPFDFFVAVSAMQLYLDTKSIEETHYLIEQRLSYEKKVSVDIEKIDTSAMVITNLIAMINEPSEKKLSNYEDSLLKFTEGMRHYAANDILIFKLLQQLHIGLEVKLNEFDKEMTGIFRRFLKESPTVEVNGKLYYPTFTSRH